MDYQRERARNAYKKEVEYFKNEMKYEIRQYPVINFDAKMKIKFKAMGLRRECLDNYRNSVKGIEYDTRLREHTDCWNVNKVTEYKNKNIHVLQYELDLTEGIDGVVNNIDILTDDNKEKLIYFNDFSCYKARF